MVWLFPLGQQSDKMLGDGKEGLSFAWVVEVLWIHSRSYDYSTSYQQQTIGKLDTVSKSDCSSNFIYSALWKFSYRTVGGDNITKHYQYIGILTKKQNFNNNKYKFGQTWGLKENYLTVTNHANSLKITANFRQNAEMNEWRAGWRPDDASPPHTSAAANIRRNEYRSPLHTTPPAPSVAWCEMKACRVLPRLYYGAQPPTARKIFEFKGSKTSFKALILLVFHYKR